MGPFSVPVSAHISPSGTHSRSGPNAADSKLSNFLSGSPIAKNRRLQWSLEGDLWDFHWTKKAPSHNSISSSSNMVLVVLRQLSAS